MKSSLTKSSYKDDYRGGILPKVGTGYPDTRDKL